VTAKTGARRASYSSPTILARRARLLEAARELIAEQGVAGFGMAELSARADVAKQTVYNIFQTKERVVAAAINEYFEQRDAQISYHSPPATMAWMIERTMVAGRAAQTIPNYMSAVTALYHSLDPDPEIWAAIHRANVHAHQAWIQRLGRVGQLQAWARPDLLVEDITTARAALVLRWVRGELDGDEWLRRSLVNTLLPVAAAALEPARGEAEAKLQEIVEVGLADYDLPPAPWRAGSR